MPETLQITLPGCISWQRPRRQRGRIAYPAGYERDRQAWASVVRAAVQAQGWCPPASARFVVGVETLNGGRRDLDRVVTAVCDALENGGALRDDCLIDGITANRRKERGAGAWTRVVIEMLA